MSIDPTEPQAARATKGGIAEPAIEADRTYLRIEHLVRRFGTVAAVDDVSLDVARGEIICLVGHSGCGKSSLLRLIAGVERPDGGRILLDGEEIAGTARYVEPEDRRIGFMFQDYALFPHMCVTDNILFGLTRLGKTQARARAAEVVDLLGIGHLSARFPHMLSGGEQQRVALARALAPQPRILLMDEPFSNLDRGLREELRTGTLAVLREFGTTVLMVTHDPEEALSCGDRVFLMRAGKIVQAGSGRDLYETPQSVYAADFFCTFNKLPGTCRDGGVDTPLGRFAAPGRTEGEKVEVCIRPHDLRIGGSNDTGVSCTVLDCTLRGEIEEVRLLVPGVPSALRVRSTTRSRLKNGDSASVQLASVEVLVF
ncbi:ABC transporter ATP-binding protein [Terrihabitans sp. B22-R8]|uniref:ABC transporter ATP-binding protein n=1 Tax=Terrihabitans sp. B22-R8 TaxID=3425128 RepID=UPI00403C942B